MTRPYPREWLVVVLVAITGLSFFHEIGPQDVTRLALTEAVALHGSLRIDRWHDQTIDKAHYRGHWYADKAPGMSFLAVPSFMALRAARILRSSDIPVGVWKDRSDVWLLRVLTGGLGFVLAVFLVGRVAEGVARGTGAITAAAFGLGTLALPLAATMFTHVLTGALGFAAFVAVWTGLGPSRRLDAWCLAGGLCVGLAVLTEYQAVFIAAVVAVYAAVRSLRALSFFLLGALPGAVALALYDTAAFGAPWRLSYRYVAAKFAADQAKGFFGIGLPDPHHVVKVLFTWDGLLFRSPVLVVAAVGLVLLWRQGLRAEALVCGVLTALFFVVDVGYYDPLGGGSPGPRFFVPALPFLAVGLAPAFSRWPRFTLLVTAISVALMLYRAGTWFWTDAEKFTTIWSLLGAPRMGGVILVSLLAFGALVVGALNLLRRPAVHAGGVGPE